MTVTKLETAPAGAPDWLEALNKREQRMQTIERFCGLVAEGGVNDSASLYWWVENEFRAARGFMKRLYRELGAHQEGRPASAGSSADLDKRTLRLDTIVQAAGLLVESGEVDTAVWYWIEREAGEPRTIFWAICGRSAAGSAGKRRHRR